uniref:Tektin n=1 Tax=Salmo trutta TaxID=8032 RepID=A0A674C7R8_SALTR
QRHHSQQTRQDGWALRHQAACKTRWDESDSRDRLVDRINEVTEQKDRLQFCVQAMEREIKALTQVKEETERALAETAVPLEVVVECLTQREGRRGSELREAQMMDTMQQELQQHISKAFEHLFHLTLSCLKEAHQQLTFDLTNETEALDVDLSCLSLTDRSPDNIFQWEQFTHYNVTRAEEEMQVSLQLRETMTSTRIQVQNDLEGQRITTGFNLRKRAHQLQQACSQLHWQHTAVSTESCSLGHTMENAQQACMGEDLSRKQEALELEQRSDLIRQHLEALDLSITGPTLLTARLPAAHKLH